MILITGLLAVAIILYLEREYRHSVNEVLEDWKEFRSSYNPQSREELDKLKEEFRNTRL